MTRLRLLIVLVPLVSLAACHKSAPKNDQRSASGEVLQGTISDRMIPLGQLTSQPPLLPKSGAPTTPEQAADQGVPAPTVSGTPGAEPSAAATAVPGTPATPAPTPGANPAAAPAAKPAPTPRPTP